MEEELKFEDLFEVIKKRILLIIGWGLSMLILSGLYTFFIVTPQFESSSRIVVNQTQNTNQTLTNVDIQTNLSLINTYQSIIKEPIVLEDVILNTNSDLTINELSNKITVQIQNNSLVFGISVQDDNPYVAAELANGVAASFEEKIGSILEVESVTILSEAVPNLTPISPNVTMNLVVGMLGGIFLGVGLSLLLEYTDKRVKDLKIIEDLGWTNLGSVLEMSTSEINETRMTNFMKTGNNSSVVTRRRRV